MGRFLTPPGCPIELRTDGSGLAVLLRSIRYEDDSGRVWEAVGVDEQPDSPAIGDGASVPALLWPIFGHPWHSDHARGGWLHDCGYRAALPCSMFEAMFCDQRAAVDQMFYQACRDDIREPGVLAFVALMERLRLLSRIIRYALYKLASGDRAYALYLGVRIGGWYAWWQHGRRNAHVALARESEAIREGV